jgi:hypothetical protein
VIAVTHEATADADARDEVSRGSQHSSTPIGDMPPPSSARLRGPPPEYIAVDPSTSTVTSGAEVDCGAYPHDLSNGATRATTAAAAARTATSTAGTAIATAAHQHPPSELGVDASQISDSDSDTDTGYICVVGGITETTAESIRVSSQLMAAAPRTLPDQISSTSIKAVADSGAVDPADKAVETEGTDAKASAADGNPSISQQSSVKSFERRKTKAMQKRGSISKIVSSWRTEFGNSLNNGVIGGLFARKGVPMNAVIGYNFVLDAMHGRLANGRGMLYFEPKWKQFCFVVNVDTYWMYFLMLLTAVYMLLSAWEPIGTQMGSMWVLVLEGLIVSTFAADIFLKVA